MRVTGGGFRGRLLEGPSDRRVRPTSDKVRQAVFNILCHNDFGDGFALAGRRVIDLFAGTGAMGVEALSRGAGYCLFVESSAASRALIRANIEALGLTGVSKVWRRDATTLGPLSPNAGGSFDLAFLDPPYRQKLLSPALQSLCKGGWLGPDAVVVAEHAIDEVLPQFHELERVDGRRYGDTCIALMRYQSTVRR